ncbi:MAG: right-handed parallel beta-helix repeat-containing protein, partial [Acidimicrobiia bacterium]|nr:right-handed parallel beta-helix repeat-containing protein [Acidimicrobiia bacterium]
MSGTGILQRQRAGRAVVAATVVAMGVAMTGVALTNSFPTHDAETTIGPSPAGPAQDLPRTDIGWSPLTALTLVDPRDHGAIAGDGVDDSNALQAAIDHLGASGGLVYFPDGQLFEIHHSLRLAQDHVKLWSPSGNGGVAQLDGPEAGQHAILCDETDGCGFFGLRMEAEASRRLDSLLDHQITLDGAVNSEILGNDISGSAATGIFVFGGSENTRIVGNYVHHTWADGIHFTDGSRQAHVWRNVMYNEAPTLGDDGIACVTYGDAPRCRDMEWWDNLVLGNGQGRGLAVVGGERIHIHNNFVSHTAAAGILVASESSYHTSSSSEILIERNVVYGAGQTVSHPG